MVKEIDSETIVTRSRYSEALDITRRSSPSPKRHFLSSLSQGGSCQLRSLSNCWLSIALWAIILGQTFRRENHDIHTMFDSRKTYTVWVPEHDGFFLSRTTSNLFQSPPEGGDFADCSQLADQSTMVMIRCKQWLRCGTVCNDMISCRTTTKSPQSLAHDFPLLESPSLS